MRNAYSYINLRTFVPSKAPFNSLTRTSKGHTPSRDGLKHLPGLPGHISNTREKRARQSAKYRFLIAGLRLITVAVLVSILVDMIAVSMMSLESTATAQTGTPTHPAIAGLFTDIQVLGTTIHRFAQATYVGLGVLTAVTVTVTVGKRVFFALA